MNPLLYSIIMIVTLWTTSGRRVLPEFVTYKELEDMEANCERLDTCQFNRTADRLDIFNCHCGKFCTKYDTCCIDSPHKLRSPVPRTNRETCTKVYGNTTSKVFMVNSCPVGWRGEDSIAELCEADAESMNDPLLMIPVTSRQVEITYRNYFCFLCNNDDSATNPMFWNIRLSSDDTIKQKSSFPELIYDHDVNSWTIEDSLSGSFVPVEVQLEYDQFDHIIRPCRTNIISKCSSQWKNNIVRRKCSAYMAIVMFRKNGKTIEYRNPHCALCNNEDLKNMACSLFSIKSGKKPFSFALLLDVNRSDGDIVGEVQQCNSGSLYDPFFKKCRVLKCAIPGYSLKNGKCSRA